MREFNLLNIEDIMEITESWLQEEYQVEYSNLRNYKDIIEITVAKHTGAPTKVVGYTAESTFMEYQKITKAEQLDLEYRSTV